MYRSSSKRRGPGAAKGRDKKVRSGPRDPEHTGGANTESENRYRALVVVLAEADAGRRAKKMMITDLAYLPLCEKKGGKLKLQTQFPKTLQTHSALESEQKKEKTL